VGDPLAYDAFADELEKLAIGSILGRVGRGALGAGKWVGGRPKAIGKGLQEAGERVLHPVEGMRKGWRSLSPRHEIEALKGKELKGYFRRGMLGTPGEHLKRHPLGQSLTGAAREGRVKGVAEELSRRGWTGKTRATKYLPVGQKGLTVGFGGMALPDVIHAQKATPTGEGAVAEKGIGEAAGLGGMVLGSGLGLVPSMGLWYGAHKGGAALGRIIDRLRAGGSVGQAVRAPSPEEAARQLQTISRYYE
jgi:hypothetical protein